jgi:hypothetical protein
MAQKYVSPVTAKTARTEEVKTPVQFVFGKANYQMFFIAIAVVVVGFLLMTGTTDIYDTRKIVIAPLVVLAGFGVGFVAIFRKPGTKA